MPLNLRLDLLINKRKNLISRTRIKNLILNGKLMINNKMVISPSKKVLIGDKIEFQIPEPKDATLKPFNFKSFDISSLISLLDGTSCSFSLSQ